MAQSDDRDRLEALAVDDGDPIRRRSIATALAAFIRSSVWDQLSEPTRLKILLIIWGGRVITALDQHEITDPVDADLAGEDPELYNGYCGEIWLLGDDDWPPLYRFFRDPYKLLRAWGPLNAREVAEFKVEAEA